MSSLPAEAEVPRTSFTVRSFNFLCPNPEDSRSKESARRRAKGLALGERILARRARASARLAGAGSAPAGFLCAGMQGSTETANKAGADRCC
jgi:anti-sigma factor RsiW